MLLVLSITAALMVLRLAAELVLSALNRAEVRRHAEAPPAAAAAIMDPATYRKSVAYTLEKSRLGAVAGIFDTLVTALVLFGGVLPLLFAFHHISSLEISCNSVPVQQVLPRKERGRRRAPLRRRQNACSCCAHDAVFGAIHINNRTQLH